MIDIHCHILPGVDDGAKSLEESLSMAKTAVEDGIHTIVATPHTLNGIYLNPAHEVISGVARLQDVLTHNHIDLQLCPGADIQLCPGIMGRIREGEAGTINNNQRYILLELPAQTVPPGVKDEIFNLKVNGITPIITHPERHPAILRDMTLLQRLVSLGALVQVTAMSITGDFGEVVMQYAERLLTQRLVHVIASDAHSPDTRPPILSRAVEAAAEIMGNHEDAERMVTVIPEAILSGDPLELPEPMRKA
ncbi:MAG: CpsB/CapC family capsule biosynthesis tyrosine phosphatase [Pseudomonadota bacterium]